MKHYIRLMGNIYSHWVEVGVSPNKGSTNAVITKLFQDGVELNWLPPVEPNGEVHYVIYIIHEKRQ